MHLSADDFAQVIHATPLVSLDLIVRDAQGAQLLDSPQVHANSKRYFEADLGNRL